MNNLYFPICAVLINILIFVVFFSKKRIKSDETKAYSLLITIALLESSLACILVILMNLFGIPNYIYNIHRIDYILILLWVWALFNYVLIVSLNNNKKLRTTIQRISMVINIIISVSFFFLKVNVINEDGVIDTNGQAMNVLIIALGIYVILILLLVFRSLIRNIKSSNNKKFIPLFFLAILGVVALVIRRIAPEVLMISLMAAYADLIMIFTIENPDVKMIYELNKNKKLLESMSEEKSNFLFSMSQDTKKPIENILEVKKMLENEKDLKTIDTGLKVIENNARGLKNIINNVLDISSISSSKLVVSNETYNIYPLLDTALNNVKSKLNPKVSLRTNISKNIPMELYGDSVKLKQVITSILFNAAKFTKEGYIELSANEIVKYDVCRLIIEIEDSGKGMSVEKLNELLKSNSDLEDTDLLKLNNLDVDLKLAFKIIRKLGGFINIKSEENKGSTFTIVIDQKIKQEKDPFYSKYIFNKKKVIAVSDNLQTLKSLNSLSNNYDIDFLTTMHGNDLVQRIEDGEVFDLIILEDEARPDSALAILGKLQEAKKGFNVPTIVMLNKNKESIKEHYIEDGFSDYLRKENMEEEFDRIIKKYI
ncbi:MAG TPA: hypothetical protein IAB68_01850 [Candidatus Aphodocola excrementigallinarum]|uniref:histidine kinase n=1 Tax=Candidatus Aphodocola excrementigallinarum TaxID=2840670 RepID=A0A9D1LIJ0_9FIRM|nr:hypothetical protein [Candidatus Aphodocola excrementigallinarum]